MTTHIVLSKTSYSKVFTPLGLTFQSKGDCQRAVSWQVTGGNATDFKIVTRREAQQMYKDGYIFNACVMPWAWHEFIEELTGQTDRNQAIYIADYIKKEQDRGNFLNSDTVLDALKAYEVIKP